MTRYSHKTAVTSDQPLSRSAIVASFLLIGALTFILRIWYSANLYQDDGLWFTAAEEILRGQSLYRDIFFDKPPGLPLLYAGLFSIFGAHILTIRLFTICYSVAICGLLYVFGSRLYDKRTGLVAAVLFSVFSTTYISGDMQSLNTDLLMAPFYSAGAFLLIQSSLARGRSAWLALAGGALSGVAFQINPKGAFDLIFFALLLAASRCWQDGTLLNFLGAALKKFGLASAGFVLASLPFFFYLAATHALSRYKLYVWNWGLRYAGYYPVSRSAEIFLHYGTDYFLINNLLLIMLIVVAGITIHRLLRYSREPRSRGVNQVSILQESNKALAIFQSDATLLIWFAVSFTGVAAGGRFFAHYYFQVIPALCLIGASGLVALTSRLKTRNKLVKATVPLLLIVGFVYTLARSHSETAELAVNWLGGKRSRMNREARLVAAIVREVPDPADAADSKDSEAIRQDGPRTRPASGPADYLFVWGNLPEVYYWSGLLPASGYLSSQPLTGVPADVWYGSEEYRLILDDKTTAVARAELLRELEQAPPRYIIDELGFRDARLSIERYPDLQEFLKKYARTSEVTNIPIFIRKSER